VLSSWAIVHKNKPSYERLWSDEAEYLKTNIRQWTACPAVRLPDKKEQKQALSPLFLRMNRVQSLPRTRVMCENGTRKVQWLCTFGASMTLRHNILTRLSGPDKKWPTKDFSSYVYWGMIGIISNERLASSSSMKRRKDSSRSKPSKCPSLIILEHSIYPYSHKF